MIRPPQVFSFGLFIVDKIGNNSKKYAIKSIVNFVVYVIDEKN